MNCKPGDLAVVIRAPIAEDNIGAIVKVIEPFRGDYTPSVGFAWVVELTGRPLLGVNNINGKMTHTAAGDTESVVAFDHDLRPLRPGEPPDDTATDEPLELIAENSKEVK